MNACRRVFATGIELESACLENKRKGHLKVWEGLGAAIRRNAVTWDGGGFARDRLRFQLDSGREHPHRNMSPSENVPHQSEIDAWCFPGGDRYFKLNIVKGGS
eukprot:gene15440-biopygen4276